MPETCTVCKKEADTKRCAKCKTQWYCSRDCQKTDWRNHKKDCARIAGESPEETSSSSSSSSRPAKNLSASIPKPFHKLHAKTWLHDRPSEDVYKLLIDTYRLRMEDQYTFEGEVDSDCIYGGAPGSLMGFRRFLRKAEAKSGLLPPWWSAQRSIECQYAGLTEDGWSSLNCAIEKHDNMEHYGDSKMPMQMRMFGEQIYGRGPGGQNGEGMMRMMMQTETGEGECAISILDLASMIR